ncbi:TKL protein kinase [Thecamonas trahens ATCC 50062]|uniref:TKL protein kinase n=1 Tax=Thecamonas trahens ATCC 50062 TaxID=461836 RepID=A0A0L0DKW8_THETB|nr:TKL protein kinase [Thecamonas trahens ATCC 50062]KNC52885.1 TKL protein kinase [Thecamonas trahens ATCC 50062]|eukprot:XP_013754984.1 TKL protein kinase [Thecamonas trahens ATCC 50062]
MGSAGARNHHASVFADDDDDVTLTEVLVHDAQSKSSTLATPTPVATANDLIFGNESNDDSASNDIFYDAGSSNSSWDDAWKAQQQQQQQQQQAVSPAFDFGPETISMDLTAALPTATQTLSVGLPVAAGSGGPQQQLDFVIQSPSVEIIPWSELEILGELGAGGQASVVHASWRFTDVAVKVVAGVQSKAQVVMLLEEVAVLCTLRHTNTILCMGVCSEPEASRIAIVTEYMAGGDLAGLIHRPQTPTPVETKLRILFDANRGLHYLHATEAVQVHRDIKPSNILLTDRLDAKLADFGISGTKSAATSGMLTHRYASPEMLAGKPATWADDMYAMGLVMVELLSDGVRPFAWLADARQRTTDNYYAHPYRPADGSAPASDYVPLEFMSPCLPDLVAIIARCFSEPASRPTTADVLNSLNKARTAVKRGTHVPDSPLMRKRHEAGVFGPPAPQPQTYQPPQAYGQQQQQQAYQQQASTYMPQIPASRMQQPAYDIATPELAPTSSSGPARRSAGQQYDVRNMMMPPSYGNRSETLTSTTQSTTGGGSGTYSSSPMPLPVYTSNSTATGTFGSSSGTAPMSSTPTPEAREQHERRYSISSSPELAVQAEAPPAKMQLRRQTRSKKRSAGPSYQQAPPTAAPAKVSSRRRKSKY